MSHCSIYIYIFVSPGISYLIFLLGTDLGEKHQDKELVFVALYRDQGREHWAGKAGVVEKGATSGFSCWKLRLRKRKLIKTVMRFSPTTLSLVFNSYDMNNILLLRSIFKV